MMWCVGCECQETLYRAAPPERLVLELVGMGAEGEAGKHGLEGESEYRIDIDADGAASGVLVLGVGDVVLLERPASDDPRLSITLSQPVVPAPGERRTLLRDDFGAAAVDAVIGRSHFADPQPRIDLAYDLATGAIEGTISGVMEVVAGAEAPPRVYTINVEGITPLSCAYHHEDPQRAPSARAPDGRVDLCPTLEAEARALPKDARTPALPWPRELPEDDMVCGF